MTMLRTAASAALALLVAACSGDRYALRYTPSPAEAHVAAEGGMPSVRVLASVLDAERVGEAEARRFEMRLRLRVENMGEAEVSVHPRTMLLVDADLESLSGARFVGREPPLRVAPGEADVVDVAFPLGRGVHPNELNLDGLDLRWTVEVGGQPALLGATFTRRDRRNDTAIYGGITYPYYGGYGAYRSPFVGWYRTD